MLVALAKMNSISRSSNSMTGRWWKLPTKRHKQAHQNQPPNSRIGFAVAVKPMQAAGNKLRSFAYDWIKGVEASFGFCVLARFTAVTVNVRSPLSRFWYARRELSSPDIQLPRLPGMIGFPLGPQVI